MAHDAHPELVSFLHTFNYGERRQQSLRAAEWSRWDSDGVGYLSLAKVDSAIMTHLVSKLGHDQGEKVWKRFRPSYIRAFTFAKDVAPVGHVEGPDGDSYITKAEFRLLISYLRHYATWFEVFALVDGNSDGTTAEDDRRISREEWEANLGKVRHAGSTYAQYVAFRTCDEESFDVMDADGKGMVLLSEFCTWVEKAEIAAGTPAGADLKIGDDADEK